MEGPNWWLVGAFTVAGAGMLAVAYVASSYWQGVLDNGGTALLLFALLVFSEPRLVRHLSRPRNLDEAASLAALVAPLAAGTVSTSAYIRERVLRAVGGTGLHQDVPGSSASSARFTNLGGAVEVEWCIGWDDKGLRHVVTVGGKSIPRSLGRCIGWDKKITVHEAHVYRILCYLLRDLEPHA